MSVLTDEYVMARCAEREKEKAWTREMEDTAAHQDRGEKEGGEKKREQGNKNKPAG